MQQDERHGEEREPDVALEPGLQPAHFQRRTFTAQTEQRGENKNSGGNGAVNQTQRRAGHAAAGFAHVVMQAGRQLETERQRARMKFAEIQQGRRCARQHDERGPAPVLPVDDHLWVVRVSNFTGCQRDLVVNALVK